MGTPKADRYLQSHPMFLISPRKMRVRDRAGQVVAKWWREGLAQSYFRHPSTIGRPGLQWCHFLFTDEGWSRRVWRQGHIMTSLGPVPAVGSGYVGSAWRGVQIQFQSSELQVLVPWIQNNRSSASYSSWQWIWPLSLCRKKQNR